MSPEDAEEYTQALELVQSGGWRQVLLGMRMGVPEALGLTTREWAQRIGGHVQLSIPERQETSQLLIKPVEQGGEGLSTRQAADVLGIGKGTLFRDTHPAPNGAPAVAETDGAEPEIAPDGASESDDDWEPCAACGAAARRLWLHDEDHFGGRVLCQRCALIEDQAVRRHDEEPTLGELVPPDLELPSGKLTPEQRVAFAIGRLHVGTKYTAADITDAFFEAEAACGDRDFCHRHLEKLDDLLEWLAAIRGGMGERLSGPRLHAVGTEH